MAPHLQDVQPCPALDAPGAAPSQHTYRIGEVAQRAKVSTRTLRYYGQLGLVSPSSYSSGGSRRYTDADVERLLRIRELQSVMGFNLDDIAKFLAAEDRLAELRREFRSGAGPERRADIVGEVAAINARTQEQVATKIAVLRAFQADLEADARSYRSFALAHDIVLPRTCTPNLV